MEVDGRVVVEGRERPRGTTKRRELELVVDLVVEIEGRAAELRRRLVEELERRDGALRVIVDRLVGDERPILDERVGVRTVDRELRTEGVRVTGRELRTDGVRVMDRELRTDGRELRTEGVRVTGRELRTDGVRVMDRELRTDGRELRTEERDEAPRETDDRLRVERCASAVSNPRKQTVTNESRIKHARARR